MKRNNKKFKKEGTITQLKIIAAYLGKI